MAEATLPGENVGRDGQGRSRLCEVFIVTELVWTFQCTPGAATHIVEHLAYHTREGGSGARRLGIVLRVDDRCMEFRRRVKRSKRSFWRDWAE